MGSISDTLNQLRAARDIVLHDPTPYPQVIAGILQVISPSAQLEARRWGADFLAESFASQVVASEMKQQMSLLVLDTLEGWLERKKLMGEEEDACVVKSAIQCAASIYPFVFRHVVDVSDKDVWKRLSDIKSAILGRMDSGSPGVRICCIKFATRVVQTQTPGVISDPRRPEHNEISLALVPRDHAVVSPSILEAQASGLLDRLLSIFHDNPEDALVITATLNAMAPLVQKRPSIMTKIIPAVLSFDPLRLSSRPMSSKDKVLVRSMTRTTMSFLLSNFRMTKNNPFAGRIQQHLERLKHTLNEAFSEAHQLKRRAPEPLAESNDESKRQRLDNGASSGAGLMQDPLEIPPLPQGPISLAQLFTLTNDARASTFPAQQLNLDIVNQLIPAIIQTVSQERIEAAVNAVRGRVVTLHQRATASIVEAAKNDAGDDDDDDYDPSMGFGDDAEKAEETEEQVALLQAPADVAIGSFSLPIPQPLTDVERDEYSKIALTRVFGTLAELDKAARTKDADKDLKLKTKSTETEKGFNRLAASTLTGQDREGWAILLTRLATRASVDPKSISDVKKENQSQALVKNGRTFNLANGIRQALMNYIMENFRVRIDIAIMWLNEEWYSERVQDKFRQGKNGTSGQSTYWDWTLKLFDAMSTYFDIRDGKILIRFLSEVPAVNRDMLNRAKKIAEDPDRVQITVNALLYLIMMRPPVRGIAIDCIEEMWRENEDARPAAQKILAKHRPAVLQEQQHAAGVKAES